MIIFLIEIFIYESNLLVFIKVPGFIFQINLISFKFQSHFVDLFKINP